jgi:transcriptional regulator of acetoin/glycerol metabolism
MDLPHANKKIENFKECERDYICRLMVVAKGNVSEAAKLSGLTRATIYRKIAQYGVQRAN